MRLNQTPLVALSLGPYGEELPLIAWTESEALIPGQALLVLNPAREQTYWMPLYPIRIQDKGIVLNQLPDPAWRVGDTLEVIGPLGRGYQPPPDSNRWLLAAFDLQLTATLPLIDQSLMRGASTTLWSNHPLPELLPPQIEITLQLADALDWADYIACETCLDSLPALLELFRSRSEQKTKLPREILIQLPMPCGMGGCNACLLDTVSGWKHACLDGPLWAVEQLRHFA